MQASIPAERGNVSQLEELLALDRRSAGESRVAPTQTPLRTAVYTVPLRVILKQRWREERRACVAALGVVAAALVLLGFQLFAPSPQTLSSTPAPSQGERSASFTPSAMRALAPRAEAPAPAPAAIAVAAKQPAPVPAEQSQLSVQVRLQRADLWLRIGTPRAAQEARRLLESALAERPESAHGQAALAQACLILEDQRCARTAVEQAQRARPWRASYRSLSRHIERMSDVP